MKRHLIIALLTIVMALSVCNATALVLAEDSGLTFSANDMYKTVKTYTETPNTFQAWIKASNKTKGGIIIGSLTGAKYENCAFSLEVMDTGAPILRWYESRRNDGKWNTWLFNNVNLFTDEWTHLSITRSINEGKVHCYVNGKLSQSIALAADKGREDTLPAKSLCIGGDMRCGNDQYFKGEIRSIALFTNVRGSAEIRTDKVSPLGQEGLLVYYDLNGHKAGTDIEDLSGNGYDVKWSYNMGWIDPKDKEPVTDYAYSFAVVGDTQKVNYYNPQNYQGIYDYIIENIEEKNIQYVFGLGDITDNTTPAEWERAKLAAASLDGKVGYSFARGNHDWPSDYVNAFPWSKYQSHFDGSYGGNVLNTYKLMDIGKVKYLFITLDFGPSDDVLNWAGNLCEEYSDRNVIIITHGYLCWCGQPLDENHPAYPTEHGGANDGTDMWDKLVSKYENISMIISGHIDTETIVMTQRLGRFGNTVTQLLVNPQSSDLLDDEGYGMVAMLYFSEDGKNVTLDYYSTVKEKYYMSINQFDFEVDVVKVKEEPVQPPVDSTDSATSEKPTTSESNSNSTVNDNGQSSGCKSSMSASAISLVMMALCVAVVLKRKIIKA